MKIGKLFQVLVPKDKKFFPLFEQSAENMVKSAMLLNQYFLTNDKIKQAELIIEIKKHESIGDGITHQIYEELNKTYITPFDREDIQHLAGKMDDVVDYINSACQMIKLYKPKSISDDYILLSELIVHAVREVKTAINELKHPKKSHQIKKSCVRINEIENKADDIYYNAISELFAKETDAIELIKIKEILGALELATDRAEDVSDVIKTIIVKLA